MSNGREIPAACLGCLLDNAEAASWLESFVEVIAKVASLSFIATRVA